MATNPKVAVITGASRGLGAGIAEHLAEKGIALGLCARHFEPRTEPKRLVRPVDVTDREAMERFMNEVVAALGEIDLWINNAGLLAPIGPLHDNPPHEVEQLMRTNIMGPWHGTQLFVRHVRARQGSGVLINISSGAATQAVAGWSAYCASKAAMEHLTQCVALEEAKHGLRVYSVAPGVVDTAMQALIRETPTHVFPERDRFVALYEQQRFNTPAHVAKYLLALARGEIDPNRVVHRVPNMHA